MKWRELKTVQDLDCAQVESNSKPVLLFKHSTRCSVSQSAKDRLERNMDVLEDAGIAVYYLDLLQYREISNLIASRFQIVHQSPQVILLKNGSPVYHQSHMGIQVQEIICQNT